MAPCFADASVVSGPAHPTPPDPTQPKTNLLFIQIHPIGFDPAHAPARPCPAVGRAPLRRVGRRTHGRWRGREDGSAIPAIRGSCRATGPTGKETMRETGRRRISSMRTHGHGGGPKRSDAAGGMAGSGRSVRTRGCFGPGAPRRWGGRDRAEAHAHDAFFSFIHKRNRRRRGDGGDGPGRSGSSAGRGAPRAASGARASTGSPASRSGPRRSRWPAAAAIG
jgi:hypothetical protein